LFEAVAAMLRGIGQPVVLVIDDVQWADTPSILLMRHLARHDDAGEVFFVVTYRDAAPAPAAFITETMARLVRDGIAERIVLEGLGESDVEALIRATTRAEILPDALDLSRHLCELTGGNPFFLTEILRDLDDRGTQIDPRQLREATPVGVRDVVAERLARLSETTTLLLHIAAVVGQEFELSLIAEVSGLDEGIVLDAVETALGARLVHESSTIDRFVFTHAIVRNVIYRELPASRRVRLHRRVGEAIELDVADQTASRATELAHHFLEAAPVGGAEKGAGYAVVAAREAEARLAFEAALELCDRALEALRKQHAVPDVECDLLIQKGRAELSCGRDGARTTLFDAFEMADQINDPDRMAAALLSFTRGFFSRMGRTDTEYVQSIERAISARPPGDDTTTAELLGTLASELVWSPDGERRFALSDEALAMSRRLEDGWALARVLLLRNMTISAPDTLEERTQECAELSRLAEQLQDPGIRFQAAFHRSGTAHEAGDIGTADQLCDIASEIALERREPTLQWMADFMQTSRSLAHGELVEAERLAQQGHAIGRRANRAADAQMFFGEQILEIRRWQDRLVEMLPFFGDLAGDDRFDFGYTLLRYLFDAGETTKATRIYGDVMSRVALPPRRDMLAMPTLCSLSYLAARVGDTEHAPELYAELLPWAHTVGKTIVARPVGHHCLGMLAASMHDGDTAEHHLTAAIAAHDAMRMPLLAAESRLERAKVIVERGGPEADGVAAEIESVRVTAEASGAAMLGRCCDELRLGSR
jgi:hypothetical protein